MNLDGRRAVSFAVPAFWHDHRFQGRAVLPAVEALRLLAVWAERFYPGTTVVEMVEARFDKFLELAPGVGELNAFCDLNMDAGGLRAALVTKSQAGRAAITRTKEHVAVCFNPPSGGAVAPSVDPAAPLDGDIMSIDPAAIYAELVPFGPSFRSICRPLSISANGAQAHLSAPVADPIYSHGPLGSPFPLDGAFHAACVWSQRFVDVVAFPVGFERRRIFVSTRSDQIYLCRVFPLSVEKELLRFDIWIVDLQGRSCEAIWGVRMRDVSGGKLTPPEWISHGR